MDATPPNEFHNVVDPNALNSPNFAFLAEHHRFLVRYAALAERYVFDDPNTALIKLRQFGELLAQQTAAYIGIFTSRNDDFRAVLGLLRDKNVLTNDVLNLFHDLRSSGNAAAHEHEDSRSVALRQLQRAHKLAIWFHKSFGDDKNFKPSAFIPPPEPAKASRALEDELNQLRQQVVVERQQREQEVAKRQRAETAARSAATTAEQEAARRRQVEAEVKQRYDDLRAALSKLAEQTNTRFKQTEAQIAAEATERAQFEAQLVARQQTAAEAPKVEIDAVIGKAQQTANKLGLHLKNVKAKVGLPRQTAEKVVSWGAVILFFWGMVIFLTAKGCSGSSPPSTGNDLDPNPKKPEDRPKDKPKIPTPDLTPLQELIKKEGQRCRFEMMVRNPVRMKKDPKLIFLNSEREFSDPKNVAIVIDREAEERLRGAGVSDPVAHFKNKMIRVTGKVSLYQGRVEVKIRDPDQIEIVSRGSAIGGLR